MRHTIEFGGYPQDVTITTHGEADIAGFTRFNEELVSDPRFVPGMAILVDHTDLDTAGLTSRDIEAIAYSVVRLGGRLGPSLSAIVAPSALTFGLARMSELDLTPRSGTVDSSYVRSLR